jgi:hypothetical protein
VLEKEFRAFLRDPVAAWEHGARDAAGIALRLVGDDLAESALAAVTPFTCAVFSVKPPGISEVLSCVICLLLSGWYWNHGPAPGWASHP